MCVIRNTLLNGSYLILASLVLSTPSWALGTPESHLEARIKEFAKTAGEKAKQDQESSASESSYFAKTKSASTQTKDGKTILEGDGEEPNPPGVTVRPKDTEKDSDSDEAPGVVDASQPSIPAVKSAPIQSKSSNVPALNVKPGTAEPAIVFPGSP